MPVELEEKQSEFEHLLQQLAEGSGEALAKLMELYSGNILRAVRRSLPQAIRPKVDSIDIFQSVWISVLAKPGRLTELDTPQRMVAYLTSMARLKVLEKYRHFTRSQACDVAREQRMSDHVEMTGLTHHPRPARDVMLDAKHPPASALAEAHEVWKKLLSACDQRDQHVVQLRLSGMSQAEIAEQLQVSTRTVRRSLHRLLHTLSE